MTCAARGRRRKKDGVTFTGGEIAEEPPFFYAPQPVFRSKIRREGGKKVGPIVCSSLSEFCWNGLWERSLYSSIMAFIEPGSIAYRSWLIANTCAWYFFNSLFHCFFNWENKFSLITRVYLTFAFWIFRKLKDKIMLKIFKIFSMVDHNLWYCNFSH